VGVDKQGTYPQALGVGTGHGVDSRARLVDKDGGHDMNAADEF